jgi:trk system potassium uptake protein TrkH
LLTPLAAAIAIFVADQKRTLAGLGLGEQILASLFQSVTARTAGFNTVDIPALHTLTLYFIILLMFIGASPGSTGGGVKTSTIGALYAFARAKFRGDPTVHLFQRTIPDDIILRAFVTVMFALSILFIGIGGLIVTEPTKSFVSLVFEAFSAFGTVGLSMDVSPKLSSEGKIIVILLMFIGRVGPLTLAVAVAPSAKRASFRYSEESVMIG